MRFGLSSSIIFTVLDSLYVSKSDDFNFSAVINDCKRLLASDLVTSDVSFICKQTNEIAYSFARVALRHAIFHIHLRIPSYISNEMQ